MTRIAIRPVKGRGPPRERAEKSASREPRGPARVKSPEDIAEERADIFKKNGCRRQYPECPSIPDYNHSACHSCPHFPQKFKK
jgi:hypothetical protein